MCAPREEIRAGLQSLKREINSALQGRSFPGPFCPCGGSGSWHRIAFLDVDDDNYEGCPGNWSQNTDFGPIFGCGRASSDPHTCDSAVFSSNGLSYSRVCGRVIAYQKGSPNAFNSSITNPNKTLEDSYIDGLSLTHGRAGMRQHIWTFAAATYETESETRTYISEWNCACTNTNVTWPHTVPQFVGNNYFCATGNPGPGVRTDRQYSEDPLWDGVGCGPTNTCCQLNNPPWFCATLPQPTTDDLELRICNDQEYDNENVVVTFLEISVK